jgi:hypothetical protein
VHAADDAKVIRVFGQFGEDLGYPESGFPMLGELEGRTEQLAPADR